jgi:hypothetical protein
VFVSAEVVGGLLAYCIIRVLNLGISPDEAAAVVLPHDDSGSVGEGKEAAAPRQTTPSSNPTKHS